MVLLYPVISFDDSTGHRGSRDNLLGKHPDPSAVIEYSNQLQVTDQTPPAFIVHAEDDKTVPVMNSIVFMKRWCITMFLRSCISFPGAGMVSGCIIPLRQISGQTG